ncbi:EamA family transporter [Cyanobium sp. T1G-Tous]|uniref:EamA family transporter n=1 Tax=Cyanobium sp. T1G-Tous TaxID=2823722 RepID=UPI0020CFDDE6|nr:EamA family transporter [Cyanobium sp. T1G-Tous]MCP9804822.1 EamA family transporter [Cyanobium sp. T1G-Tous]
MKNNMAPARSSQSADKTGIALALATTGLEALQPLVLVLAYQLGSTRLVNGHNPINFCNGLLFGNAFSLVALLLARRFQRQRDQRSRDQETAWNSRLAFTSLLPIGCNALLEVALVIAFSRISAIQVTLTVACTAIALMIWDCLDQRKAPKTIPTVGAVLVALSAWIALGPTTDTETGVELSAMGVKLIPNTTTGNGLLLVLILMLGMLYYKYSEPVTREASIFAYAIWQTGVQTFIFFIWAITTFGLAHLYDLQSPLLWQAMLVYGGVISTAYTLVEAAALAKAGGTLVALCEGFLPFASGLLAWLILREQLTFNLVISCVIAGAGIGLIEAQKLRSRDQAAIDP